MNTASLTRASGILLHPTSLPSPYGIGDLGQAAYDFVNFLEESASLADSSPYPYRLR